MPPAPPERSPPQPAATEPLGSAVLLYPYRTLDRTLVRIRLFFTRSHRAELWFWALCIFLLTTPFTFHMMGENPVDHVNRNMNTMRRADFSLLRIYMVRLSVFAVAFALALPRWRLTARLMPRILPMTAFLLWVWLSVLWSDAFTTTLNSALVLTLLLLSGFLIGIRLPLHHAAKVLVGAAFIIAVTSLMSVIVMPSYGVHQMTDASQSVHAGAWRGVYLHKNHFGQLCGICLSGVLMARRSVIHSGFVKWTLAGLLFFLILRSTSASAVALVPLTLMLSYYIVALNPLGKVLAGIAAIAGGLVGLLSFNLMLEMLGRDATFSGRTNIWESAATFISRNPLHGYGFNSTNYGGFTQELNRLTGLADPHNGYVDLVLGTGFIGLTLFLFAVVMAWIVLRGVYRMGGAQASGALVIAGMLNGYLISTITEANVRPLGTVAGFGLCTLAIALSAPRLRRLRTGRFPALTDARPDRMDEGPHRRSWREREA